MRFHRTILFPVGVFILSLFGGAVLFGGLPRGAGLIISLFGFAALFGGVVLFGGIPRGAALIAFLFLSVGGLPRGLLTTCSINVIT